MPNFPGYTDLEKAKKALNNYVKSPQIRKSGEPQYHLLEANRSMNKDWQILSNGHYFISSQTYLSQTQEYWAEWNKNHPGDEPKEVLPVYTVDVEPMEEE